MLNKILKGNSQGVLPRFGGRFVLDPAVVENRSTVPIGQQALAWADGAMKALLPKMAELPDSVVVEYKPLPRAAEKAPTAKDAEERPSYNDEVVLRFTTLDGTPIESHDCVLGEYWSKYDHQFHPEQDDHQQKWLLESALRFAKDLVAMLGVREEAPQQPILRKFSLSPALLTKRRYNFEYDYTQQALAHYQALLQTLPKIQDTLDRLPETVRLEVVHQNHQYFDDDVLRMIYENPRDFSQETVEIARTHVFEDVSDRFFDLDYCNPNAELFLRNGVEEALRQCETLWPGSVKPEPKDL